MTVIVNDLPKAMQRVGSRVRTPFPGWSLPPHLPFYRVMHFAISPSILPYIYLQNTRCRGTVVLIWWNREQFIWKAGNVYFTQFLGRVKEMVTAEHLVCLWSLWVWSNRDSCPNSAHSLTPYLIWCPCTDLDAKAEHWTQPVLWFFFLHTIYLSYACEGCVFIPSLIQPLLSA